MGGEPWWICARFVRTWACEPHCASLASPVPRPQAIGCGAWGRRRALKRDSITDDTLDLDATQVVAEKQEAHWTYKGERRATCRCRGRWWTMGWSLERSFAKVMSPRPPAILHSTRPVRRRCPKANGAGGACGDPGLPEAVLSGWTSRRNRALYGQDHARLSSHRVTTTGATGPVCR